MCSACKTGFYTNALLLQHRNGIVQENSFKVYTGHTNSDTDNTQVVDLSFNENEGDLREKRNSFIER